MLFMHSSTELRVDLQWVAEENFNEKQWLYKVALEKKTEQVKELRYQYVEVGTLLNNCTVIVFLLDGALHDLVCCHLCFF